METNKVKKLARKYPYSRTHKTCLKCMEYKPLTNFRKINHPKSSFLGTYSWCKECETEYRKKRQPRKTQDELINKRGDLYPYDDKHKTCTTCLELLPLKAFAVAKTGFKGKDSKCNNCKNKNYFKKWYAKQVSNKNNNNRSTEQNKENEDVASE